MFVIEIPDVDEAEGRLIGSFLQAVLAERQRAHAKHGATSMEQAPPLDPWRGLILGEEALECGKALNDNRHEGGNLLYPDGPRGDRWVGDELDKELIQTASMAFTWWANRRGHRLPRLITEIGEVYIYSPTLEDPHGQAQPQAPGPAGAGVEQPERRQAGGQAGDGQAGLSGEEPAEAAQPPAPVEAISVQRDLGDVPITKIEHAWNYEPSRWPPT